MVRPVFVLSKILIRKMRQCKVDLPLVVLVEGQIVEWPWACARVERKTGQQGVPHQDELAAT